MSLKTASGAESTREFTSARVRPSFTVIVLMWIFSLTLCGPKFAAFDSVRRHQYRGTFVLHEEHDELSRFGLACVPPDDVNIIWAFVEALTGCQSHFLPASHLHHD